MATCDGNDKVIGCGAPIEWVEVVRSGKRMPIDRDPVDDGNIVKTGGRKQDGTPLVEYAFHKGQDPLFEADPRYVSHFSTCPHAADFRKGKR